MDLIVQVKDVAETAIAAANIQVSVNPPGSLLSGITDGNGQFVLRQLSADWIRVTVTHSSYIEEQVGISFPVQGTSIKWDNPVCAIVPPARVVVHLSRLKAAHTFAISNTDLAQRSPFNPQAAFTWIDDSGNRTDRYLNIFNDIQDKFILVAHPLFPSQPTDGWGRLNHEAPTAVDPSRNGDTVWLEWGLGGNEPRLLVCAWIPRLRRQAPGSLDFVIFFSPNTAGGNLPYPADSPPWVGAYPYQATRGQVGQFLGQPYVGLGHKYLFANEKHMVYQLMAANRHAVVLCPIQPYGQWGPFGQAAGLARLVLEVLHFMHRTGRTSGFNASQDQDKAPLPNDRLSVGKVHVASPSVGRVVLGGFSAGMAAVQSMLGTSPGQVLNQNVPANSHLTQALFGANVNSFLSAWKEVWDFDAEYNTRNALDGSLPGWLNRDSNRMARCYQSAYTGTPRNWIEQAPLVAFTPSQPAGNNSARERHSDRCSLVFVDWNYLDHASPSTPYPPVFWKVANLHQAMPMVMLGHAARLSGLTPR
jgi:hypothetical protein